jgi:glycosyltransferase involved in cell wall biosynthesis
MHSSVLSCTRYYYLDDSNGAAVAHRSLLACLVRRGISVQAVSGTIVDAGFGRKVVDHLTEQGLRFELHGKRPVGANGLPLDAPNHITTVVAGVPVFIPDRSLRPPARPDAIEAAELQGLLALVHRQFRPQVLLTYGGDPLTRAVLASANRRGIASVFALHNLRYRDPTLFQDVAAVTVPSRFAAEHYARTLGLACHVLPNCVELDRIQAACPVPCFVTFVNPCAEKGLFAFARIADELGRHRPDIPILVVESRGTSADLAACGLDLTRLNNLHLMSRTHDPRTFWGVTRVAIVPSVVSESQGLVAVEAMANGIPVVASDRGALPETLGDAGIVLPLPDGLTPATRQLPTADEVAPWIEAIIRLWDDPAFYAEHSQRARKEFERFTPEALGSRIAEFFRSVRPQTPSGNSSLAQPHGLSEARRSSAIRPSGALETAVRPSPSLPRVTVIMPMFNGANTLGRALDSLSQQTFRSWELIVVDDASTDGSPEILRDQSRPDARVRIFRLEVNSGPAAARNLALREARGSMIAYLDCDDEYYPDYLARVDRLGAQADVLVSSYDLVRDEDGPDARLRTWNPAVHYDRLPVENIATPLGVAHRRDLWSQVGGFDERLRFEEDWDLWKRFAQVGARFLYVTRPCGLYHIRPESLSRAGGSRPRHLLGLDECAESPPVEPEPS